MIRSLTYAISLGLTALTAVASMPTAAADNHWQLPPLPEPVTNNAVAQVETANGHYFVSLLGLDKRKTYQGVHSKGWRLKAGDSQWQPLPAIPHSLTDTLPAGRLAATAASARGKLFLFGGYTVDANHHEVSIPDVQQVDPLTGAVIARAPMPVPVDDAVSLTYRDRYIYLVSGWHNDGNVNLVQVYDSLEDSWRQASPFPGVPVFGHAGGISGNTLVICDGVKVVYHPAKRRDFDSEPACYRGDIDGENPLKIRWHTLPHPTGEARYRMAARGVDGAAAGIYFIGGSNTPYNYNGIGYNRQPASASAAGWFYDIKAGRWSTFPLNRATMDHRGLVRWQNTLYSVGGMLDGQQVTNQVIGHAISR